MKDDREPLPLATCMDRLQRYDFSKIDLETAILFEWLVVKGRASKYKAFACSHKKLMQAIGIKRRRLERVLGFLESLGIISMSVQGIPPVTFFQVHFDLLDGDEILLELYQGEHLNDVHPFFRDCRLGAQRERRLQTKLNRGVAYSWLNSVDDIPF